MKGVWKSVNIWWINEVVKLGGLFLWTTRSYNATHVRWGHGDCQDWRALYLQREAGGLGRRGLQTHFSAFRRKKRTHFTLIAYNKHDYVFFWEKKLFIFNEQFEFSNAPLQFALCIGLYVVCHCRSIWSSERPFLSSLAVDLQHFLFINSFNIRELTKWFIFVLQLLYDRKCHYNNISRFFGASLYSL